MLFLFAQLMRSTQLSPGDYLQTVVGNKPLCKWTKTEFPVLVNFSHGGVTRESNNYLRRSDMAINTFEHVVV